MARIRTIKPEIWGDERFGELDTTSQLVYLGLISNADDAGRLIDSVRLIDGLIWPWDDSRTARESLRNLSGIGLIKRGKTSAGQGVIQIVGWADHQKVNKPNLKAALPPIAHEDNDLESPPESLRNHSGAIPESFRAHTYDLRPTTDDQRPASNARAREGQAEAFNALVTDFGRGDVTAAEKAYYDAVPERVSHDELYEARKAYCRLNGPDRRYWKNLAAWINADGWKAPELQEAPPPEPGTAEWLAAEEARALRNAGVS